MSAITDSPWFPGVALSMINLAILLLTLRYVRLVIRHAARAEAAADRAELAADRAQETGPQPTGVSLLPRRDPHLPAGVRDDTRFYLAEEREDPL